MRSLLRTLVFLALLIGGGLIAIKAYLHSDSATGQIAARLQSVLGVPVTVGGLELGSSDSAATNIAVYESGSATGSVPFVVVGRATTDIGITDFITGSTEPAKIALFDAHLTLRYDRDGHLLTKLPAPHPSGKPMPEFRLERGTLTICKQGEPDCTFHGMNAVLIEKNGNVTLSGHVTDMNWGGAWTVTGSFPQQPSTGSLELRNAGLHVTQEMLRRVPFVPTSVWQNVSLDGDTPVQLVLTLPPPPAHVGYRVSLAPQNTKVYVPSIDLTADAAQGQVVIDNNFVMLREVRGKVAEGDLHVTSADLDFRNPTTMMKFDLDGRRLNIHSLPAKWKLPARLGGKLSGMANLVVRISNGHAIPLGTGEGQVEDANYGFLPIGKYGLRIKADQDGFSFERK